MMVKFQQRYQTRHGHFAYPLDRLDLRTLGYPQNGTPFSPPLLGVEFRFCLASFSSEKSYSPSRLRCCQATAEPWPPRRETPPGWRYPWSLLTSAKGRDNSSNDAVLDEQLAGFR